MGSFRNSCDVLAAQDSSIGDLVLEGPLSRKHFVQVGANMIEMDSAYVFPFKYFPKHYAMDHRLIIGPS